MQEIRVLVRVDGRYEAGIGQVVRTLTLIEGLAREYKIKSLFLLKGSNRVAEKIEEHGFEVTLVRDDETTQLCSMLDSFQPDLFINDCGDTSSRLGEIIEKSSCLSLSFDDRGEGRTGYSLVINAMLQTLDSWASNVEDSAYSGSHYMVLKPDFAGQKEKEIKKDAGKILITFGGSDILNLTSQVVEVLAGLDKEVEIMVVLGPTFTGYDGLEQAVRLAETEGKKVSVLQDVEDMAQLMGKVDLAISGGGITLFELAATGTPTGVISADYDQNIIADRFAALGAVINFGLGDRFAPDFFLSAIENLLDDYERRKSISKKGRELVDGRGRERVIKLISKNLIKD